RRCAPRRRRGGVRRRTPPGGASGEVHPAATGGGGAMTAMQTGFLVGFTAATAVIVAFTGLVAAGARRTDGGAGLGAYLSSRLSRRSYDRGEGNRWAFYAHRISGFAVFTFLAMHILDVSLYAW